MKLLNKFLESQKSLYQTILQGRGAETQLRQCQEEAAELIVAINHHLRNRKQSEENLIEEFVDCLIMMHQISNLLNEDELLKMAEKKINSIKKQQTPK